MTADPFLDSPADTPKLPGAGRRWLKRSKWIALAILVVLILYYPVGMIIVHKINDDPSFTAGDVPQGQSKAVALAAALIQREVIETVLAGQRSLLHAGLRARQHAELPARHSAGAGPLRDRNGGPDRPLPRLRQRRSRPEQRARLAQLCARHAGMSARPRSPRTRRPSTSRRWSGSAATTTRLAAGKAAFEPRADNLISTLDRIGKDLGAASNAIDQEIDLYSGDWFDLKADNVFYYNKGLLYANALLLRDLGVDFKNVLDERGAGKIWQRMVDSMLEGASLQPLIVINGDAQRAGRAQSPDRPGLLPAARPHAAGRADRHSAEIAPRADHRLLISGTNSRLSPSESSS